MQGLLWNWPRMNIFKALSSYWNLWISAPMRNYVTCIVNKWLGRCKGKKKELRLSFKSYIEFCHLDQQTRTFCLCVHITKHEMDCVCCKVIVRVAIEIPLRKKFRGRVFVIPRKKVILSRNSACLRTAHSDSRTARNGTEFRENMS